MLRLYNYNIIGTIIFAYGRQVNHLSKSKKHLLLSSLKSKLIILFSLVLEFFVSRLQAIYKAYLFLLYYVIIVITN